MLATCLPGMREPAVSDKCDFAELMARIREGDEGACTEVVERYSGPLLRCIRSRLRNSSIRRFYDSGDFTQSVWGAFFSRTQQNHLQIQTPAHLIRLLQAIARNKVKRQHRKHLTARRDVRRMEAVPVERLARESRNDDAPERAAKRELIEKVRSRLRDLVPEDRYIIEERMAGRYWSELSEELGTTVTALRMRQWRLLRRLRAAFDPVSERESEIAPPPPCVALEQPSL